MSAMVVMWFGMGKAWLALFFPRDVGMDNIIGMLWMNVVTMVVMVVPGLERLGFRSRFDMHVVIVWVVSRRRGCMSVAC